MRKEIGLSVLVIALLLPGSLPARDPDFREFGFTRNGPCARVARD